MNQVSIAYTRSWTLISGELRTDNQSEILLKVVFINFRKKVYRKIIIFFFSMTWICLIFCWAKAQRSNVIRKLIESKWVDQYEWNQNFKIIKKCIRLSFVCFQVILLNVIKKSWYETLERTRLFFYVYDLFFIEKPTVGNTTKKKIGLILKYKHNIYKFIDIYIYIYIW